MTFYIDIIIIENLVMNYIILLTTGIICKINIKQIRILFASALGGLYAVMMYITQLKIYLNQITKILLSISMIYIAFNSKNIKGMIKQLIIFYLTSFCFGGAAYYLLYCVNPNLIKTINGVLIGTYPIKVAILGGILGFFIINISFKLIKSKLTKKDMMYNIDIFFRDKKVCIKVMLDTGNLLSDPVTGTPVLIVESEKLIDVIPKKILGDINNIITENILDNIDEDIKTRCSIIPFSSIGKNNGMILGFRPDYINICTQEGEKIRKKVIIGIHNDKITKNGLYSGLMGLNLLNNDVRIGDRNEYNSNVKI